MGCHFHNDVMGHTLHRHRTGGPISEDHAVSCCPLKKAVEGIVELLPLCRTQEDRIGRGMKLLLVAAVVVLAVVDATVYFEERFEDGGECAVARAAGISGVGLECVAFTCFSVMLTIRCVGRSVGAV